MDITARARGTLLGLACGDALGRPVEGWPRSRIASEHGRLTEMQDRGIHGLPAGEVTDDTELALCLARSLVESDGFHPDDAARRFAEWFEGDPTGIGGMTRRVLSRVATGEPWDQAAEHVWTQSPEGQNAGNGSVMRCAPLAIRYATDAETLVETSVASSRLTHWDPRCTHGCSALNLVVAGFLRGEADPVSMALERLSDDAPAAVTVALREASTTTDPTMLPVTAYVVDTLEAGVGHALLAETAEEAIVTAVNNGGDTDTVGAVAGAVAGARFGAESLPAAWLNELTVRDEAAALAERLADQAG
ncbi:ADP-ribosylglycohydrolase family protein [Halomicroarcula sp. GCM10025324]|uniref:ADP-ribosylglycohydrolase family protein n=1 Tax=Haloarcula TaxID=2237 RepID=UPI0023E8EC29|nr:ADP-ribosylglycohydrolase family protein [Halomicroarcula sp. ZS-22-S1]